MIKILEPNILDLQLAAQYIVQGEVVAFPTETVYGLGANAYDSKAVDKIYQIKNRPSYNPLIAHYHSIIQAEEDVVITDLALRFAHKFMPGPLTLVLKRKSSSQISKYATGGLSTLAIRIPANEIAQSLIKLANVPIVAPSANPSTRITATELEHVIYHLQYKLGFVINGGDCKYGIESTIIDLSNNTPLLLREGSIPVELIEKELNIKVGYPKGNKILAPGMSKKHYAPNCKVRFGYENPNENEGLLAFGPNIPEGFSYIYNLSIRANLQEAAYNLYKGLHDLENKKVSQIALMPIPNVGLGKAINDRLKRATHIS